MGLVLGPSPRFVVAKTVTLISDDTGHRLVEISNVLLQNPLVQLEAENVSESQTLPELESEYVTV